MKTKMKAVATTVKKNVPAANSFVMAKGGGGMGSGVGKNPKMVLGGVANYPARTGG